MQQKCNTFPYPINAQWFFNPVTPLSILRFKAHYVQCIQGIDDGCSNSSITKNASRMTTTRNRLQLILAPSVFDIHTPCKLHHLSQAKQLPTDMVQRYKQFTYCNTYCNMAICLFFVHVMKFWPDNVACCLFYSFWNKSSRLCYYHHYCEHSINQSIYLHLIIALVAQSHTSNSPWQWKHIL